VAEKSHLMNTVHDGLVGNRDGARGRTGDTVPGMKTLRAVGQASVGDFPCKVGENLCDHAFPEKNVNHRHVPATEG
jgi:hypothetical protein